MQLPPKQEDEAPTCPEVSPGSDSWPKTEFRVTSGHQPVSGHFLERCQETELICDGGSFSLCLRLPHVCQYDELSDLPTLVEVLEKLHKIPWREQFVLPQ